LTLWHSKGGTGEGRPAFLAQDRVYGKATTRPFGPTRGKFVRDVQYP